MKKILFLLLILALSACQSTQLDIYPAENPDETFNMVVEIPAGTNHKYEYNHQSHRIVCDQKDGKDRIIDFLPYPGNYGFIPSTLMTAEEGGDGDPLDIILLSESIDQSEIISFQPIGIMYLIDGGENDFKIVGIPAEESKRIIKAITFMDLQSDYASLMRILEEWFLNYKGPGEMELNRWGDEKEAEKEIRKWIVSEE